MRHHALGRTGLFVSELCLGTMTFGGGGGIWGQIGNSQQAERELIPTLNSEGVGLMVWSPLAGGLLSGKYGREHQAEEGSRRTSFDFPPVNKDRAYDCIDAMRPIAQAHGVSVAQVALAWLLHQPQVTSVIVGAKQPQQLADNLAATQVTLSGSELAALDEVSCLPIKLRASSPSRHALDESALSYRRKRWVGGTINPACTRAKSGTNPHRGDFQ